MDHVIEKLSEIDVAASRILEGASNQKLILNQQQEERIAAYNRNVEAATEKEIRKLQAELSTQLDKELKHLETCSATTLKEMDEYYEKNHEVLSTKIYETIIRK